MDVLLQIVGVLVPIGGLFAWSVRRMDRRFEEAALDRRRIEIQLSERCDRIEADFGRLEAASKSDFDRLETKFKVDFDRLEAAFKEDSNRLEVAFKADFSRLEAAFEARSDRIEERCDRIEERIDRVAGQLSDQIMSLSLEIGKAQGAAASLAVEAG